MFVQCLSVGAAESVVVLVEVVMVMSGVYVCSVSVCWCCGVCGGVGGSGNGDVWCVCLFSVCLSVLWSRSMLYRELLITSFNRRITSLSGMYVGSLPGD